MEAIYFGNIKVWGFGTGNGPWIMADMENGLFSGTAVHLNSNDPTTNFRFTTAMIKGGQNHGPSSAATPSPAAWPPTSAGSGPRATTR